MHRVTPKDGSKQPNRQFHLPLPMPFQTPWFPMATCIFLASRNQKGFIRVTLGQTFPIHSSSVLISFSCSILPISSPTERPNPNLCRVASSSNPERLALCFFSGLPTTESSSCGALSSCETPGNGVGGVAVTWGNNGGVDPLVGVFDAGDFRVAGDLSFNSTECCRFSYLY